jgi:hypothetical protein
MSIKDTLNQEIKTAMKAGDKSRLSILRMMSAAFKQVEIDERCIVDDAYAKKILQKMKNQRVESQAQYQQAQRDDLAQQEIYELGVIAEFLPVPFSTEELRHLVLDAIEATGAQKVSDISRVMEYLSDKIQDRASSKDVGAAIRSALQE